MTTKSLQHNLSGFDPHEVKWASKHLSLALQCTFSMFLNIFYLLSGWQRNLSLLGAKQKVVLFSGAFASAIQTECPRLAVRPPWTTHSHVPSAPPILAASCSTSTNKQQKCTLFVSCHPTPVACHETACPAPFHPVTCVALSGTHLTWTPGQCITNWAPQQALVGSNWRPGTHLIPVRLQFQPTDNQPEWRKNSWSHCRPPANWRQWQAMLTVGNLQDSNIAVILKLFPHFLMIHSSGTIQKCDQCSNFHPECNKIAILMSKNEAVSQKWTLIKRHGIGHNSWLSSAVVCCAIWCFWRLLDEIAHWRHFLVPVVSLMQHALPHFYFVKEDALRLTF